MEAELQSAVSEYRSQLGALEELLAADPANQEARELYEQLQGALQYTLAALGQVGGGQQAGEQQQAEQQAGQVGSGEPEEEQAAGSSSPSGAGEGVAAGGHTASQQAAGWLAPPAAAPPAAGPRGGAPNNARMHPANRYFLREPDFGALAERYEQLRPYVSVDAAGRAHFASTSWAATRALTACLLRHDFGLAWWLPEGQLVPPVPNRANYLHWINDLLQLSAPGPEEGPIRGLDIGCGANFIYCLLGAALYGWRMVGVDVTQVAVQCCRKLIADNPQVAPLLEVRDLSHLHPHLQGAAAAAPAGTHPEATAGGGGGGAGGGRRGRKRPAPAEAADDGREVVVAAAEGDGEGEGKAGGGREGGGGSGGEGSGSFRGNEQGILLPAFQDPQETFAFTMCNPPFFESMQEAAQNPNTAFGGTAAEMVCAGGEVAFVMRMLADSELLRGRVHWFSTMVGKKSTLKALRKELHSRHVTALRTTELAQGKTSRWAVAWSWQVHPNKASQPLRRTLTQEEDNSTPTCTTATAAAAAAAAVLPSGQRGRPTQQDATTAAATTAASTAAACASADRDQQQQVDPGSGHVHAEVDVSVGASSSGQQAERAAQQAAARAGAGSLAAAPAAAASVPVLPRRHISFAVQLAAAGSQQGSGGGGAPGLLRRLAGALQERCGCSGVRLDAAAWTVSWPLQVGPFSSSTSGTREGELEGAGGPRGGAGGEKAAGGSGGGGSLASNITARLRIAQQQRGRVEVVATIPNGAPDAAARAFTSLMASLEAFVTRPIS